MIFVGVRDNIAWITTLRFDIYTKGRYQWRATRSDWWGGSGRATSSTPKVHFDMLPQWEYDYAVSTEDFTWERYYEEAQEALVLQELAIRVAAMAAAPRAKAKAKAAAKREARSNL